MKKYQRSKSFQIIAQQFERFDYSLTRLYKLRLLWLIPLLILFILVGGIFVSNFENAITPSDAVLQGYPPMPSYWEAGVRSAGEYFRWYTAESNPVLYYFSWFMFVGGLIGWFGLSFFLWIDYLIFKYKNNEQKN